MASKTKSDPDTFSEREWRRAPDRSNHEAGGWEEIEQLKREEQRVRLQPEFAQGPPQVCPVLESRPNDCFSTFAYWWVLKGILKPFLKSQKGLLKLS